MRGALSESCWGGGGGRSVFERIGIEEIVDRGFFGYAETETMVLV